MDDDGECSSAHPCSFFAPKSAVERGIHIELHDRGYGGVPSYSIILYHTHFLTTGFEALERVTLDLTKEDASAIVLAQCSS